MSDLDTRYKLWEDLPLCCKTCKLLQLDKVDDKRTLGSCSKDIRLPVVKQTCKQRVGGETL